MKTIRIFISSCGDVAEERERAESYYDTTYPKQTTLPPSLKGNTQ